MHELDIKDSFTKEVASILLQLEARINDFSQGISVEETKADNEEASDMNTLKLHRYKMKELLIAMETISEESWRMKKDAFQKEFKAAEKTLELTP